MTVDESAGDESDVTSDLDESDLGDENADGTTAKTMMRRPATPSFVSASGARPGKWSLIAAAVAAMLFVGSAAFGGASHAAVPDRPRHRGHQVDRRTDRRQRDHDVVDLHPGKHRQAGRPGVAIPQRRFRGRLPQIHRRDRRTQQASPGHQQHPGHRCGGGIAERLRRPPRSSTPTPTSTSPATKDVPSLKYLSYRLAHATGSRALAGHQDDHRDLAGPDAQVLVEREPSR